MNPNHRIQYHDTCPAFLRYFPTKSRSETEEEKAHPAKWSNQADPPPIGAMVEVKVNGIGPAKVLRYFTEHGYLGLWVDAVNIPEWMWKQNGNARCHVFGVEVELDATQ